MKKLCEKTQMAKIKKAVKKYKTLKEFIKKDSKLVNYGYSMGWGHMYRPLIDPAYSKYHKEEFDKERIKQIKKLIKKGLTLSELRHYHRRIFNFLADRKDLKYLRNQFEKAENSRTGYLWVEYKKRKLLELQETVIKYKTMSRFRKYNETLYCWAKRNIEEAGYILYSLDYAEKFGRCYVQPLHNLDKESKCKRIKWLKMKSYFRTKYGEDFADMYEALNKINLILKKGKNNDKTSKKRKRTKRINK